jgi:hypothetical protein
MTDKQLKCIQLLPGGRREYCDVVIVAPETTTSASGSNLTRLRQPG